MDHTDTSVVMSQPKVEMKTQATGLEATGGKQHTVSCTGLHLVYVHTVVLLLVCKAWG